MMHTNDNRRILIIGDAVAPTGFARVIRSIFQPLHRDFELHQMATRYDEGPHDYSWPLYPAKHAGDVYGYNQLPKLVHEIRPAVVFLLYDISFQTRYLNVLRRLPLQSKTVFYSPVEAGPIAPEIVGQLQGVTRYVLFTEYSRKEIAKSLELVRSDNADFQFPELEVIPHGVACERFYPLDSDDPPVTDAKTIPSRRLLARKQLGINDAEHREAFIVLNANRNMPRKRIDLTLQGFAEFARDKPANVKLYLHMATEDTGWNVIILARRYGIYDRLMMSKADNSRPEFPDELLNVLYNACDVGITTTTGEGWGMVSFEHAATKSAQIIPRHTSLAELWDGAAEFIEPTAKMTYPGNLTEGLVVSVADVAKALERVYQDRTHREKLAEAAYQNARRPEFRWDRIAEQWRQLFCEVIEGA